MISVISPTFNCKEYIQRSFFCLKNQTFDDWEWIVVDDGSTDDSFELLSAIQKVDNRIKIFRLNENMGRGYARNFAISKCTGDIVTIWDIDDLYLPNRLFLINEKLKEGYDFFCSAALIVDKFLNLKGARHFYSKSPLTPSFVHPTLAFKRSITEFLGYNINMRAGEDLEIMLMLEKNYKGFYSNEYLIFYFEDREINLKKTIISFSSHIRSSKFFISKNKDFFSNFEKIIFLFKSYLKLFILNILRIYPKIYLKSVNFRYLENIDLKKIDKSHLDLVAEISR